MRVGQIEVRQELEQKKKKKESQVHIKKKIKKKNLKRQEKGRPSTIRLHLVRVKIFSENRYFSKMLFFEKENIFMCLVVF